ncbi:MAG: hypothetical protein KAV87_14515, partial [Desulfobacteraceae bacterium]|nr:hypothetical protein [Desulfobacteraceae bacterium]
ATKLLPGEVEDAHSPSDAELISIENLESDLRSQSGYIVYFREINWRRTLSERQLHQLIELDSIFGTESGSIFTLKEVD